MTLLEIDLKDVLSETDPDDRVVVWAPVMREGPSGELIGTRRKTIPLTDGVGSDEVVPGPLMVQVQCKAMSDTRPREVVVPETGPVTLTDLLQQTFTYTPAVVNRSLTQITTARDDALADVDGAVDQALAGSQHYSGTGFPNGVVTAPVGSIYTDTAATAGAVRWIKTSGTGATGWLPDFADTGWRRITPVGPPLTGVGDILFRRAGSMVHCRFIGVEANSSIGTYSYMTDGGFIPSGFRPEYGGRPMYVMSNPNANPNYIIGVAQGSRFRFQNSIPSGSFPGTGSQAIIGQMSWSTLETWPTTLPGTPA